MAVERERATCRFAAAQKLFQQQTKDTAPLTPTTANRRRKIKNLLCTPN
jgi:hypothetical protein